ncbi:hypothetical protein CROQUDRAFT_659541 [Cronartium quercuum f. sp. fusiforme G11]|uniref:Uncharacterized protein n=1 Tax=Cronartium quercuum f. sp. fusiforme G11 TaxID=708437 RepID=A0A9P6NDI5_9BASI|nr:hypothetical protein CROQUDRAFT_659541 [Cronartium quercuum f. sp. fusiforme G11]
MSSIVDLFANIPPGVNPYTLPISHLKNSRYPPVPRSTFKILTVFAVIHLLITWVSCMVVVGPLMYNKSKRQKYLWLMKSAYASKAQVPFRVPNSVFAVTITQLVSSIFCLLYISVDYAALQSPVIAKKVYLFAWLQLMWVFGFFGYWITGWAGLCTILCSPIDRVPRLLRPLVNRPHIVNLFHFIFPAIVTAGTFVWIPFLVLAYRNESEAYYNLHAMVVSAAEKHEAGQSSDLSQLMGSLAYFIQMNKKLNSRLQWNSFYWAGISFFTLFFCVVSGLSLIKLIRRSTAKVEQLKPTLTQVKQSGVETSTQPEPGNIALALRKCHIYVLCHSAVMMTSIVCTILACLVTAVKANSAVLTSEWRSLGAWLYHACGVIVAIALILQSWRMFTGLDIIITESQPGNTTIDEFDGTSSSDEDYGDLDEFTTHDADAKEMPQRSSVQIRQALVGVRVQRAQVLVVREAF